MVIAIVDLGTNTFNLLIAECSNGSFRKIYADRLVVKLGEGKINEGIIAEPAYLRGIEAMMKHADSIKHYLAEKVYAFATSAVRDASNGKKFIQDIYAKTEIQVEIIDGDREAELIYYGNRAAVKLNEQPDLIMDIGGGSTEFIIATQEKIFWKKSYRLGAARLLEKFKPEDPISEQTKTAINTFLNNELNELITISSKFQPKRLIGSSGAFDSMVDMVAGAFGTNQITEGKTAYPINLEHYHAVSKRTIGSTMSERLNMKGLIPMRVDMIVISFILVDFVLHNLKLNELIASSYSLKEGALLTITNK